VQVRLYKEDDFDQVVVLYKNKASYGGNYDPGRDTPNKLLETANEGNLYVAVENSNVVGTFMILDNAHSFWLLRFAVDPQLPEKNAIEEMLLEKAIEIAKKRGHDSIIVYTDDDNRHLNERYKELHFNRGGKYRCYWKDISDEV